MPRKETPETRADPTPGKGPMTVGDRGARRPKARATNRHKVDEAAARDVGGADIRDEPVQRQR